MREKDLNVENSDSKVGKVIRAGLDACDSHGAVCLHELTQINLGEHVEQLVLSPVDNVRLERDWVETEYFGVLDLVGNAEVELEQNVVGSANDKLVADERGQFAQDGLLFGANVELEELKERLNEKGAVILLLAVFDVNLSIRAFQNAEVGLDHHNARHAFDNFFPNIGHVELRLVDEVNNTIAALDVEGDQLVHFLAFVPAQNVTRMKRRQCVKVS